ncbi:MAG TPA: HNH endonuclease signature motif containing protein [Ignavibacteria bacterium]
MKRQINESEKQQLLVIHRNKDGRIYCFIDNEPIEDTKNIHFDHIDPFAKSEETSLDNIAPVCKNHNLAKKDMSLSEYRDKLSIEKLFKEKENCGKQLKLNDVLVAKYNVDYAYLIKYEYLKAEEKIQIKYFIDNKKTNLPIVKKYPVFICPITELHFFYAQIPVRNIINDGKEESEIELQPRPLILDHFWNLYRHLRVNTQLQPSICRIEGDNPIFVFDGQHKAAAKIWAGAQFIDAKIFIEPDVIKLMKTNLVAHDKLKQLRFYSSILADKLSQIYGINWQKYIETAERKSEKGFCNFIKYSETSTDEKPIKQIEAFIVESILKHNDNKILPYVAPENKTGKQYAISRDSLNKYYFRYFITSPPLDIEIDSKEDFRNHEIENNVFLLNLLADKILIDKWNPVANSEDHRKAERIFRTGSIMAWFPILRNVIYNKLDIINPNDADKILFRNIPPEKWLLIENFINKMFSHKIWLDKDPNIDIVLGNKKAEITKKLFDEKGFTDKWILGLIN